ncbi:MAG: HD domain-containing protein [Oscillospiraceae bacterium]|nr:HD domain-containing protein [Oscillospiraceae bacterium]
MLPSRSEAEQLLRESEKLNPGPWGDHSRVVARCAERIALECGMDAEKAYIVGLLHDIGRRFGVKHLAHVADGYSYMLFKGWDEAARICLTHSFNNGTVEEYIGRFDVTDEELGMLRAALASVEMDDYDRLIQLCDSVADARGVVDIEERMGDVKRRYGRYPLPKWNKNLELKALFETKMGKDLYTVIGRSSPQK